MSIKIITDPSYSTVYNTIRLLYSTSGVFYFNSVSTLFNNVSSQFMSVSTASNRDSSQFSRPPIAYPLLFYSISEHFSYFYSVSHGRVVALSQDKA